MFETLHKKLATSMQESGSFNIVCYGDSVTQGCFGAPSDTNPTVFDSYSRKLHPGIYALGESPDCPRKPAPDMVYKAMREIGVEHCVYVGDSEVDVLTANNAGVPCLSVLWGFRDKAEMEAVGGTHFCEDPRDLAEALERILTNAKA